MKNSILLVLLLLVTFITQADYSAELSRKVEALNGSYVKGDLELIEIGNNVLITGAIRGLKPDQSFEL